jgi:hypothetical protein
MLLAALLLLPSDGWSMINSESVVRVWDGQSFDNERFLLIEQVSPSWCMLQFCDLALPEGRRCFLSMPCRDFLLEQAAMGIPCEVCHAGARCQIELEDGMLNFRFGDRTFLLLNEWLVLPEDVQIAVSPRT